MLLVGQLRELIIKPALNDLVMFSDDAEELLIFTCAVESLGGTYLKQIKGPALGIYQMEPATYNDIWQNYIINRPSILSKLITNFGCNRTPEEDRMIYDLRFATAMCRIHYARVREALPPSTDMIALYDYYKKYYNSPLGAAKKSESIQKYLAFTKT